MKMLKKISQQIILLLGVLWSWQAIASDENFTLPIKEIEEKLTRENFEVLQMRGARFENDATKRALLKFDNALIQVKWKKAERGGEAVNNQPRYEFAAYELQKLFLEPEDYVVPPTAVRCLPMLDILKLSRRRAQHLRILHMCFSLCSIGWKTSQINLSLIRSDLNLTQLMPGLLEI